MRNIRLNAQRKGFTLIEVIVSVIIISLVVLAAMEISSRNTENAVYLSQRNSIAYQDSFFLTDTLTRYHKDTKPAYDLLRDSFKITEDKSKTALKEVARDIIIPDPIVLPSIDEMSFEAQIDKVILKDRYSSQYYRFKINF